MLLSGDDSFLRNKSDKIPNNCDGNVIILAYTLTAFLTGRKEVGPEPALRITDNLQPILSRTQRGSKGMGVLLIPVLVAARGKRTAMMPLLPSPQNMHVLHPKLDV